jgi:hypothetical protein
MSENTEYAQGRWSLKNLLASRDKAIINSALEDLESATAALEDNCTRLTYAESISDKRSSTLTYFMARGLNWFRQLYGFEFEDVLSDNGPDVKRALEREHPFETFCVQLGIKHRYTRP